MKYSPFSLFSRDFLLKVNARNSFEIPKFSHISINLTSRYIVAEKKHILFPLVGLSLLSGQHPKVLRAKKSVASFKLKKNSILGCQLTLRKKKMKSLLNTLAFVVLPQMKRERIFSYRTLSEPRVLHLGFTEFLSFPGLRRILNFLKHFRLFNSVSYQYKTEFEKKTPHVIQFTSLQKWFKKENGHNNCS